jgi:predicted CXXCH cytochrome family protein
VVVNTQIATPNTPTTTGGPGYVSLTWSTTDTDIANYKIYRSTTTGFTPDDATNLLATIGNTMSYTDTSATYPNTYYYKVKSVDTPGNVSAASLQASGAPQKVNPHGSYGTNTAMCSQCHDSHKAQGTNLIAQTDITTTCYLCHDAGGQSTYNVASEFGTVSPYNTSHHKVPEGTQACNDCHNPHNNASTNNRLLQTSTGKTGGNDFCWSCHGPGSALPVPNGDHQTNYPSLGSGHNNNTWIASNGKLPFDPDFDTASPGKPGIGCEGCHQEHGSSLVKLLRVVDWNNDGLTPESNSVTLTNNKDFCFECHKNAGRTDGVAESDNAWLGETIYNNNAIVQHNGTTNSCTSKCHQPHGSSFASRYLGPNETGFDYLKYSYDQNYNIGRTTVYASADFQMCAECHDLNKLVDPTLGDPAPTSFADKTKNINLHKTHLVDAGTHGKGNAVCKECHDPHGTTTAWNSSGEHLVAFPATTVAKNTLTSPKFTDNQIGGAGKGTCDLVCHGVQHKDGGIAPAINATYSGEAAASGEGGNCTSCHADLITGMARTSTSYTHPIPSDADDPNNATANCDTYCHAPHADFKDAANPGGRAANLRTTGGQSATVVTTNKDFDAADTNNGGLCMSCHKTFQDDILRTQPDSRTGTAAWDTDPLAAIRMYRLSGHNYSVTTTIKTDNSTFYANCTKCHNDNLSKTYQAGTDNTKMIGLHNTSVPWSISKFNLASNPDNEEQDFCYKCHGTATGGTDYYGTPGAGNIESITIGSTTSTHPVQNYTGKHKRFDKVLGVSNELAPGWASTSLTNRHVECGDCHDPHTSNEGDSLTSGTGTPVKKPDAEVRDVEGVVVSFSTWAITGVTQYAQQDYQVCLKCHSNWSWGTGIPIIPSKYGTEATSRSAEPAPAYVGEPKDILAEFNPNNLAYHPIFKVGKNQPLATTNPNWSSSTSRRAATVKYWGGDDISITKQWFTPTGLDHTFTDGWGTQSLVSCSDCHGSDNASVEGPHGSSYKWLLKGSDTNVTVTTVSGAIQPNKPTFWNNPTGASLTALQSNFCLNCHRADVYGPGYDRATVTNLGRFSHASNGADFKSSTTGGAAGGNTLTPYGCTNCHGGYETGGIHGTNNTATPGYSKRFMNGASWAPNHVVEGANITCTTAAGSNAINTCTKHSGGTNASPVYNYTN